MNDLTLMQLEDDLKLAKQRRTTMLLEMEHVDKNVYDAEDALTSMFAERDKPSHETIQEVTEADFLPSIHQRFDKIEAALTEMENRRSGIPLRVFAEEKDTI